MGAIAVPIQRNWTDSPLNGRHFPARRKTNKELGQNAAIANEAENLR
jgi:hypothetical protein